MCKTQCVTRHQFRHAQARLASLLVVFLLFALRGEALGSRCAGDCNSDGTVTVDELIRGVHRALGSSQVDRPCYAADADSDGFVTVDELVLAVNNALVGCPQDRLAFVIATDFQTGSFATIALDPPRPVQPARPSWRVNADATVRTFGGLVYVINRFLADNIQVIDPQSDFSTLRQCSTGSGANPHDIVFLGATRAYVSLYDAAELLLVDPSVGPDCEGFIVDRVDLAPFADADGIPEMDQMALVDGKLYVAIQRLDRDNYFSPSGPGAIVVIDTVDNEPVGQITLTGGNPLAATKGLVVVDGALIVAETGNFGVADGGMERVDLKSRTAEGFFVTEEALGGDITDFALASRDLAYAVVSKPDFTNDLVAFEPASGAVKNVLLTGVQYIPDIEMNDRGELFVSDRTGGRSGIRVFRASDGTELTTAPVDVGLPPFEFVFLQ